MKIYHLLAQQTHLKPISGDRINELNFLDVLSRFASVYYNEQLFDPEAPDFGLKDQPINVPTDKYDLYIVRNNPEVFMQLPHPKIWVAYPYHAEAFAAADAVGTFNDAWKKGLENFHSDSDSHAFFCGAYPKDMVAPKRVVNLRQVLRDEFERKDDTFLNFRYKARFGYGFTVGYFGRIEEETLPKDYMAILPELKTAIPSLNTVFAGSIRIPLNEPSILNVTSIPFAEMPYATTACDVLLGNEQPEANWAGSAKPLEAMGCQVPMVLSKRPSRVDQLGADYPLYYESREELRDLLIRLHRDSTFYTQVQQQMKDRSERFKPKHIATELERDLTQLLEDL